MIVVLAVCPVAYLDVCEEDMGNYTCELRGPRSQVLRQVTHYLFVRGITPPYIQYIQPRKLSGLFCLRHPVLLTVRPVGIFLSGV